MFLRNHFSYNNNNNNSCYCLNYNNRCNCLKYSNCCNSYYYIDYLTNYVYLKRLIFQRLLSTYSTLLNIQQAINRIKQELSSKLYRLGVSWSNTSPKNQSLITITDEDHNSGEGLQNGEFRESGGPDFGASTKFRCTGYDVISGLSFVELPL